MNINRKIKNSIGIGDIKPGACFLYGSPEELYIKTNGEYNTDTCYTVCRTRLRDGFENKFRATTIVQPVGCTVKVEE